MVEPVHVLEGGVLDLVEVLPRSAFVDEFCLVQADDGFGEGVIVGIPNRADRWFDAGLGEPVRVTNGQILGGFNWWSQHLVMKEVHGECCGASGGDSCDAGSVVVAWSAVESAA